MKNNREPLKMMSPILLQVALMQIRDRRNKEIVQEHNRTTRVFWKVPKMKSTSLFGINNFYFTIFKSQTPRPMLLHFTHAFQITELAQFRNACFCWNPSLSVSLLKIQRKRNLSVGDPLSKQKMHPYPNSRLRFFPDNSNKKNGS